MASGSWLLEEIALAAAETEDWPEWKKNPALWHPVLAAQLEKAR